LPQNLSISPFSFVDQVILTAAACAACRITAER